MLVIEIVYFHVDDDDGDAKGRRANTAARTQGQGRSQLVAAQAHCMCLHCSGRGDCSRRGDAVHEHSWSAARARAPSVRNDSDD